MKHSILLSLFAAAALLPIAAPAEESVKDRLLDAAHDTKEAFRSAGDAIVHGAREGWRKTKAYLSEDPDVYRSGLRQRLVDLGADLAALRSRSASVVGHPYFQTRLLALDQQYQEAEADLAALPPEAMRHRDAPARRDLDAMVSRLDEYIGLAQDEEAELSRH